MHRATVRLALWKIWWHSIKYNNIDWSQTIYNDVSQGFYMAPEQMQYCPTKSQIKNSASMSVTLYKQAVYKDSSIIQFKKGTTYKFNREVEQFVL